MDDAEDPLSRVDRLGDGVDPRNMPDESHALAVVVEKQRKVGGAQRRLGDERDKRVRAEQLRDLVAGVCLKEWIYPHVF